MFSMISAQTHSRATVSLTAFFSCLTDSFHRICLTDCTTRKFPVDMSTESYMYLHNLQRFDAAPPTKVIEQTGRPKPTNGRRKVESTAWGNCLGAVDLTVSTAVIQFTTYNSRISICKGDDRAARTITGNS